MKLGSRAWGQKTGGKLGVFDRLTFVAQAIAAVRGARKRRGLDLSGTIDIPRFPDSPAVVAATSFCAAVSEPWLVNHCARTFLWAGLLAHRDGLGHEPELLAVACMLHDLGLAKTVRARRTEPCFAIAGAEEAAAFASRELGWKDARCAELAEAIALHLNLVVTPDQGIEAHLLHEGAGYDVVGARRREIPDSHRTRVLVDHPRLEQNVELARTCAHEAELHPSTRLGFSFRHFGARQRIERWR